MEEVLLRDVCTSCMKMTADLRDVDLEPRLPIPDRLQLLPERFQASDEVLVELDRVCHGPRTLNASQALDHRLVAVLLLKLGGLNLQAVLVGWEAIVDLPDDPRSHILTLVLLSAHLVDAASILKLVK